MPLTTLFAIFAGVILASALTVWLAFAILPLSAASWALPGAIVLALVARLIYARKAA